MRPDVCEIITTGTENINCLFLYWLVLVKEFQKYECEFIFTPVHIFMEVEMSAEKEDTVALVKTLIEKVATLEANAKASKKEISSLEGQVNQLESELKKLDNFMYRMNEKVSSHERSLESIFNKLASVNRYGHY